MMRSNTLATIENKSIYGALAAAKYVYEFEDVPTPKEPIVDDNDVNKVIVLLESGTLGTEKDYMEELNMARYLEKVERITPIKSVSKKLVTYSNFLYVDAVAKHILDQVEKKGYLTSEAHKFFGELVCEINENVRKEGPLNVWEEYKCVYERICEEVIKLVGKEVMERDY